MLSKRKSSGQLLVSDDSKTLVKKSTEATSIFDKVVLEDDYANNIIEGHRGILRRIIPGREDRKINELKQQLVEEHITSRLELYRYYLEFRRQSLKDALELRLTETKSSAEGQKTEITVRVQQALEFSVNTIVSDFEDQIAPQLEEAEKMTNEFIRDLRIKRIQEMLERFNDSANKMLERFAANIPTIDLDKRR